MTPASSLKRRPSSGSLSSKTAQQNDRTSAGNAYPAEKTDAEKTSAEDEHFGSPAPDGGAAAWLVVLGVGAFQQFYQHELLSSYSASTIAWIPSLQIFFMSAMVSTALSLTSPLGFFISLWTFETAGLTVMEKGPLVGTLYDKYGPRQLVFWGSILHVFGLMMCSLGTQYYQILLAQGVCSAIGVSAIFQPSMNCIHGWFDKRRGAAFGILATGSSLGGVVFPIMVSRLIRQVGFPWAMRTCAFLVLALLVVANLTVRTFQPPRPQKLTRTLLAQPFRELDFVFLCAGFFCFTFGIYIPIDYLPVQALDAGVEPNLAQYLLSILNAASLFGRLFSGIMGDRIGRFNMFTVVCALTGVWVLALWIPSSSTGGIIAFAALFGFCSGAYVSLIPALVAQISPLREIGLRMGIIFFVGSVGGLVTNPISGAILGHDKNWVGVKVFAGVFCLAGTLLVSASRIHNTGWKLAIVF
ncbi:hypothetical protein EsDP_00001552 [Epichloe bromicola]|uniref:Major facilitator superfamily (MFS) profile domain-containing protein n=1 Tax=Epichloe bromicola TaxID=79588 RepID=A0ABQ0CI80_9HYPO